MKTLPASPFHRLTGRLKVNASRCFSLLLFLLAAALIAFFPLRFPFTSVQRNVHIEAGNFAFSPAVIRANPGDRIVLEVTSTDVTHGLAIDGYPVDVLVEPGRATQVAFTANRSGVFKMRCSLACGNLHPFMTGKFQVGPNLLLYRAVGLAGLIFVYGGRRPEHA